MLNGNVTNISLVLTGRTEGLKEETLVARKNRSDNSPIKNSEGQKANL